MNLSAAQLRRLERRDPLLRGVTWGLIFTLMFVATFAAGFYFDRWLHRPITVETHELCGPALHA